MAYRTLDDWLYEQEGWALRAERIPPEAKPWIETAWRLAREFDEAAVEAVAAGMYGKNWNGPEDKRPGPEMKEVWKAYARRGLQNLERLRKPNDLDHGEERAAEKAGGAGTDGLADHRADRHDAD